MDVSSLLGLLFIGVLCVFLIRRRQLADSGEAAGTAERQPYRAVSIQCSDDACDAVKALAKERYLSREAPLLSLPECDARDCQCRYKHHTDRRQDERRSPFGSVGLGDDRDRRAAAGRREQDH